MCITAHDGRKQLLRTNLQSYTLSDIVTERSYFYLTHPRVRPLIEYIVFRRIRYNHEIMTSFFSPFSQSRAGNAWFPVGPASSFPNITSQDGSQIRDSRPCPRNQNQVAGCKIFHVPKEDTSKAIEVTLDDPGAPPEAGGLKDQVLVSSQCARDSTPILSLAQEFF